jgi:3-hydroxyisobutyrate dehydrogenase-like beta-hydroxyacid dehydrogenase
MPEHSAKRPVTVLGLGQMGGALAAATVAAGHPTVVWNRTPGRAGALVTDGAREAVSPRDAVGASPVVVVVLLDHASVHEVLDPVAGALVGRTLVNVTTTTPEESRELAAWSAAHGVDYLDGGIMAVPAMIGRPEAEVLYSGSRTAFDAARPLLDRWGRSTWLGGEPGLAPDYDGPGQQSLRFSDLSGMMQASEQAGLATDVVAAVQALIRRQVDAGHGTDGFARVIESIRHPVPVGATP